MPDDYGYINTRVRMMRKTLIDGKLLEAAVSAGSYQEFLRVLSEASFAASLRESTDENAGLNQLDQALSKSLFAATQKVLGFADGRAKEEITVLLMRWDLVNLKTIARGITAGRDPDSIRAALIPGGTIKFHVLQDIAGSSDLSSAVASLSATANSLNASFRKAVEVYQINSSLLALEISLDQGYYNFIKHIVKNSSLKSYISKEIDVTNALIARSAIQNKQPLKQEFFVSGGSLKIEDYLQLENNAGSGNIASIISASSLVEAEALARDILDKYARISGVADPLGPGIVLDFLQKKEIEAAKLRLIGRAKFYHLPESEIRKEIGL